MTRECPEDIAEAAEKYHLGHLTPREAAELEDHYMGCPECAAEIKSAEAYLTAMRAAARRVLAKTRRSVAARPC